MTWGGLPLETWAFMVLATLPGLGLVVRAYGLHRRARRQRGERLGTQPSESGHRRD